MAWRLYNSQGLEKASLISLSSNLVDNDGYLAANSATKVPTQAAVKAALTLLLTAASNVWSGDNSYTGTGDFTNGNLLLPEGTGVALEDWLIWDTTRKMLTIGDSQRARAVAPVGWCTWIFPDFPPTTGVAGANITLAANGGTVVFPIRVPAHALIDSLYLGTGDSTLARSWKWAIYDMPLNNGNSGENTLPLRISGTVSYTATSAGLLASNPSTQPFYLEPGCYILAIQNTHATNTLAIQTFAQAVYTGQTVAKTKTLSNPIGSTIDIVTATWTASGVEPVVRIKCRIAGMTTVWG